MRSESPSGMSSSIEGNKNFKSERNLIFKKFPYLRFFQKILKLEISGNAAFPTIRHKPLSCFNDIWLIKEIQKIFLNPGKKLNKMRNAF